MLKKGGIGKKKAIMKQIAKCHAHLRALRSGERKHRERYTGNIYN